jgi:uncharacterized protein (TIGR00251 family)
MGPATSIDGGVLIDLLVQPRASRARFGPLHGDRIKVAVTSPPVDGAANKAVVELIAKHFGISRSQIEVTSGHSSRRKRVQVMGVSCQRVMEEMQ